MTRLLHLLALSLALVAPVGHAVANAQAMANIDGRWYVLDSTSNTVIAPGSLTTVFAFNVQATNCRRPDGTTPATGPFYVFIGPNSEAIYATTLRLVLRTAGGYFLYLTTSGNDARCLGETTAPPDAEAPGLLFRNGFEP